MFIREQVLNGVNKLSGGIDYRPNEICCNDLNENLSLLRPVWNTNRVSLPIDLVLSDSSCVKTDRNKKMT